MQDGFCLSCSSDLAPSAGPSSQQPASRARYVLRPDPQGFYDRDANLRALVASGGNVNVAVERLLSSM